MATSKIKALASGYKTSGLAYTRCAYQEGGYAETGNLVIVNIKIKTTGQQAVVAGFPLSKLSLIGCVAYDFIADDPICVYFSNDGSSGCLIVPNKYGDTSRELLTSCVYEKA